MATTVSIFGLTAGSSSPLLASGDVLPFVDISDTTQSAHGSTVKITLTNFFANVPVPVVVTSASANALAVGNTGATNPLFVVDASANVVKIRGTSSTTVPVFTVSDGTAFPSGSLTVSNATMMNAGITTGTGGVRWVGVTAGSSTTFRGMRSEGSIGSPTTLTDGTTIVSVEANGYDGTSWNGTTNAGQVIIEAAGTWSNTSHPTRISFRTTPVGSTTQVLAFSIASGGQPTIRQNAVYYRGVKLDGTTFQNLIGINASDVVLVDPDALGAVFGAGITTGTNSGISYGTTLLSTRATATPSALSATQFTGFSSTVSGATLMGFGTTGDVTLKNRAGTDVLVVTANTTNVSIAGTTSSTGFIAGVASVRTGASTSVSTAATIYTLTSGSALGIVMVTGDSGAGAIFCDIIGCVAGVTPVVIASGTIAGAPAVRTYSASSTQMKLAMAAGTYTIKVVPMETM